MYQILDVKWVVNSIFTFILTVLLIVLLFVNVNNIIFTSIDHNRIDCGD